VDLELPTSEGTHKPTSPRRWRSTLQGSRLRADVLPCIDWVGGTAVAARPARTAMFGVFSRVDLGSVEPTQTPMPAFIAP